MSVACLPVVKLLIKMLGIGLIVAAAIAYDRKRLRSAGRLDPRFPDVSGADLDAGDAGDVGVVTEAVIIGISEVDPEGLTNVSAEGIDPDAVDEAHRSVREQRERLPVTGKNIP